MTVAELILALQQCRPEHVVVCRYFGLFNYNEKEIKHLFTDVPNEIVVLRIR